MKTRAYEWIVVAILLSAIVVVSFFAISVGTSGGFDIEQTAGTGIPAVEEEQVEQDTNREFVSVEKQIYDILTEVGISHAGACGIIANAQAESAMNSYNMEDCYNKKFGVTDEEYTKLADLEQIDFVNDKIGYGLWQFTYYEFKQVLLDIAKEDGKSVGDVETQVKAMIEILKTPEFSGLMKFLKNTADPSLAAEEFMLVFERPANISTIARSERANCAIELSHNINK